MEFYRKENSFLILLFLLFFLSLVVFELKFQKFISQKFLISNSRAVFFKKPPLPPAYKPPKKLDNPPEIIKAVYVTGYSARNQKYLNYLSNIFETTEINAVVVDVKGSDGAILKDKDNLVKFFHDQNIYAIGRISVFQDPVFARARPELAIYNKNGGLWRDNNGLFWLDPASKDVWDYNISLAKDAFLHGFDEINFDYARFPSDGNMESMGFPIWDLKKTKQEVIKEFFEYLRSKLLGHRISADLFGQTAIDVGDMGIGQVMEDAFENFDYICPMVYPSHYANGFIGFANPAEHPYEIVKYSMANALERQKVYAASAPTGASASQSKLRPWLQDFDMGADYNSEMVKLEIKAVEDALGKNFSGYMLWNPANIYTAGAILKLE